MSFHIYRKINKKNTTFQGKEKDSFTTKHFIHKSHLLNERASAFTSKGSITLEAAISATIFFMGVLCLIFLFEIMATETKVKSALTSVAKEVAVETCVNPMIPVSQMEKKIAEYIGEENFEKNLIAGELDCSGSQKYWNTTIMDLSVRYKIEIPVLLFRIPVLSMEEIVRIKGWTGHETKMVDDFENIIVYVTEYGIVYHQDAHCTHLELSLKATKKDRVKQLRNQNGEIYKSCSRCKGDSGDSDSVYVTDYGDKYHFSLDCKDIKRSIYAVSITDIRGMGGCSKCTE